MKKRKNRWTGKDSYTNRIRTYIKKNDIVTTEELNKKFVNYAKPKNEIAIEHHKIRSILHSMFPHGEIKRIKEGTYKKTSNIF